MKRCYICKKPKPTTPVLMNGSAGYRRYNLCDSCKAVEIAKQEARQKKGVA